MLAGSFSSDHPVLKSRYGGHLNLDGVTLNLDGGTLTFDGGTRPPSNLGTALVEIMYSMLISNLILNTLDYCYAVLACATAKDLKLFKKIQNRAIRFAFRLKQREHITPYLKQLHFLPFKYRYRIMFKLF